MTLKLTLVDGGTVDRCSRRCSHGVMDFFHHVLVQAAGVPRAWPGFCMAVDLTTAAFVGCVLALRANRPSQRPVAGGPETASEQLN
jgi:hypothetical protein